MFFGTVLQPGKKSQPLVPHQDGFALHLSQASLAADVKVGTRASVLVRLGPKEQPVVLCTLCAGSQDTVLLDQFMTEYAELSIQGSVAVHITGYYSPEYGPDGEEEDEEDEEYGVPGHPLDLMGLTKAHQHQHMGGSSDEDSEEGESDDDDSEDEGESDEFESDDSDDGLAGVGHREPSVIIEDITDQENAKAASKAGMANGDASKDAKKRKAAAAALPAPEADGAAAAKKQAVPKQQQQQQQPQKAAAKEQAKQQQQQQQKTPADKQQQQQQKTPASKQQQKQQQQTPDSKPAGSPAAAQPVSTGKKNVRVFENGFEIHNVKMGDPHGKLAKGGKTVKVRYVGRLKSNGKVFDKTDKKPFAFRLGVGEVIKGWDRGVEGMRVGDKRKLVIPPQMGYGAQKQGPIPANSWLEFDVELLDVK